MTSSFSISEARNQLSRLAHQAEEEGPVELTRRGRPVAVVLSTDDYRRIGERRPDVFDVVSRLRADLEHQDLEIDPDEIFAAVRSREPGRDFAW